MVPENQIKSIYINNLASFPKLKSHYKDPNSDPILAFSEYRFGPQVLSGETRFLRIRAYPEKIGAEAPEQPQNSRQSQKRGIFLSALALAAGAKQAGGGKCYPQKCVFLRIRAYPQKDPPEPDFWQKNGAGAGFLAEKWRRRQLHSAWGAREWNRRPLPPATYALTNLAAPKTDGAPEITLIDLS